MTEPPADTVPRKAKKLPFKPTALRRGASTQNLTGPDEPPANDDGLQLFRRAREMEHIVAAEQERRLKRRQQQDEERRVSAESKRRLDEESGALDASQETQAEQEEKLLNRLVRLHLPALANSSEPMTPPGSKRTKLSSPLSQPNATGLAVVTSPSLRSPVQPITPSSRHGGKDEGDSGSAAIVALDSDSDVEIVVTPSKERQSVEIVADEPAEEDEFEEYVRRAEQQRARDRAALGIGQDGAAVKEKVEILVTSAVPDAKPCCMRFLFDKPLRLVRDSWTALQRKKGVRLPLEPGEGDDDIVLTWRRKKVYTFSTLLSLGVRPQGNGRVKVDGPSGLGLTDSRTRVHMEAWTPQLFQEMEREEEVRRKREAGELSGTEDETQEPSEAAAAASPPAEVKLRVVLKARDLDDVKLTVRPETTVEALVTGFRAQRAIPPERDVGLWFDGERMADETTMADADIDDMDTIEVHVK